MPAERLCSCHCCGLVQTLPPARRGHRAVCRRCRTPLKHADPRRNDWTVALAAAALIFYPPAMLLPMLRLEQLGHVQEDSLLSGVAALWAQGYWWIGSVIFAFSVLLPPLKLIALWLLASRLGLKREHHRALIYRAVEWLGRWGMLDVMLVAVLIAFVKLGDIINIYPGPGLVAFLLLVLLSLLASVVFNPALLWQETESNA